MYTNLKSFVRQTCLSEVSKIPSSWGKWQLGSPGGQTHCGVDCSDDFCTGLCKEVEYCDQLGRSITSSDGGQHRRAIVSPRSRRSTLKPDLLGGGRSLLLLLGKCDLCKLQLGCCAMVVWTLWHVDLHKSLSLRNLCVSCSTCSSAETRFTRRRGGNRGL